MGYTKDQAVGDWLPTLHGKEYWSEAIVCQYKNTYDMTCQFRICNEWLVHQMLTPNLPLFDD